MAKREKKKRDFDKKNDFDFDPNEIIDDENAPSDLDFDFLTDFSTDTPPSDDLDDLLGDEFLKSLGIIQPLEPSDPDPVDFEEPPVPEAPQEDPEPQNDPISEEPGDFFPEEPADDDPQPEEKPAALVPAFEVEPELGEDFTRDFEENFPSGEEPQEDDQPPVPVVDVPEEKPPRRPPQRRRSKSMERKIKEIYLPPAILALTLILTLTFIGTAVARGIRNRRAEEEALLESQQAASSALEAEAQDLVNRANALAAVYDYDAAIALLDTFSDDKSQYQNLLDAYNSYSQAKSKIVPIDQPASIPNLSFHCLIADPSRAFVDKEYGKSYMQNYVTIDEFSKILEQLYSNGYVLVDYDSFIQETVGEDGKITYTSKPIYLPGDKKPIMLTETLVNYEIFTVDSDGDMEPDKNGDGFACKLVVDANGNIVNEMVDANGNTVYGAYDLVPILENFIKEHPDFSYKGARAILAVTGEDGIFGYRTMHSVKEKKGEDYYNQQVEGAKTIAAALREAGYTIACYTYANVSYGQLSATKIQVDLDNWKKEVKPILGEVPVLVYAKASDISADSNYEGGKYNVLKGAGFRYFVSSANAPYAEINVNYVRQSRLMVTGQQMLTSPQIFANYFTVKDVLNELRGK